MLLNPLRLERIAFDTKQLIDPLYLPNWIASQIHGCRMNMAVDVAVLIAIACEITEKNARNHLCPRAPVKGNFTVIGKRSYMSIIAFCTDVFPHLAQGKKGAPPAQWRKFMEVHGRGALTKNDMAMETIEISHQNIDAIIDEDDRAFINDQNVCVTEQIEGEVWKEADKENRDPSGLVYIVTSPLLLAVKIGQWGGTVEELQYRYRTMYGQNLQLTYKRVEDRIQAEREMHATFRLRNISNELFERDGWMYYEQYLNCIKE